MKTIALKVRHHRPHEVRRTWEEVGGDARDEGCSSRRGAAASLQSPGHSSGNDVVLGRVVAGSCWAEEEEQMLEDRK